MGNSVDTERRALSTSSAILWLIIAGLVLLLASRLPAQTSSPEDGIRATSVLPAEAYTFKFQSAGSVDNHGDYSASIPLMTVPGRGMDYPISANYKSGITTDARASWAGLGWNVNPGSVTRVINGIPDNIDKCVIGQGQTYITENGAIVNYPPMASASYNRPINDYLDYFLVNIPGAVSGLVVPVNVNGDSTADYVFEENNGYIIQFGYRSFTRLISEVTPSSTTNDYTDIGYIYITGPDGTKYIFSLPLRSEMIMYGGVPQFGGGLHFDPRFIVEYVSSWQLTAIIGPNTSAYFQYPSGDVNIIENTGSWIRFEYNYPYNGSSAQVRNIRPLYFDRQSEQASNTKDPFGLLTQTTYLSKIITPTHEADFGVSPRLDISYLAPYAASPSGGQYKSGIMGDYTASPTSTIGAFIKPVRLDSITLYHRSPRARISFVKFNYAAPGSELCKYGITLGGNSMTSGILTSVPTGSGSIPLVGIGKTTLTEILIADSTTGSFYRFKYTDEIDGFNPPYMVDGTDLIGLGPQIQAIARHSSYTQVGQYYRARTNRMGYLYATNGELTGYSAVIRNTNGAAAWSLRTIEYPTGAIDTISYEQDSFDKAEDQQHTKLVGQGWWAKFADDEAGLRVSRIGSYDPITQSGQVTLYSYVGGHLPGLPISYLRNTNPQTGVDNFRSFLFGYNSGDVEYETVVTTREDGSRSETQYTSVLDPSSGAYDEQYNQFNFILVIGKGPFRGKQLVNSTYDASGQLRSRSANFFDYKVQFSGYPPKLGPNGLPIDSVWYYFAGGKRLLTSYTINKLSDSSYQYEKDFGNPTGPMKSQRIIRNFSYNADNMLAMESVSADGFVLRTNYARACEMQNPAASSMRSKHMLSQLSSKRITKSDNNGAATMGFVQANWAQFSTGLYIQSIQEWNDVNGNRVVDDAYGISEMITKKAVGNYDSYGNPLFMTDAFGTDTYFTWDPAYKGARLTKTSTTVNGLTFTKKYTYNLLYQPTIIEDENGVSTRYYYDGLGRLKRIVGPDVLTLKTYDYHYKNQASIDWSGGN